ncbi:Crotonobetainyl-CoA dehydrogenase [Streptomyces sp. RB5]|uniref:Crotonobetainyl-CoA dehydrogenase n=1 Tax=Streptomyces smaragdinus TaxID=2585196 RepID=A0A7K0CPT8_9ACTN|nr:acyl-CoA dehydrogenase family protein [Streptomyces smaragdinus]MQY14764.1 Crotonobetainyl-CoA dehydrogenase [Streptomyces smaragdinus]
MTSYALPEPERLRAAVTDYAHSFRSTALEMDRPESDPKTLNPIVSDAYNQLFLSLPPEYNQDPLIVDGRPSYLYSCVERAVVYEELAWGDAALLISAPGPSLSGVVTEQLADPVQLERYYTRLAKGPTWTFFAVTEPQAGSDATNMSNALVETDGGKVMRGRKKYVGNAARADLGVAFARVRPGPLGISAVTVDPSRPGYHATPIPTMGMRAFGLTEIHFDDMPVEEDDILGKHLSPTRRGMAGAMRTFCLARPIVAAMALGAARACLDYAEEHRRELRGEERTALEKLRQRHTGIRHLTLTAAARADNDPSDGTMSSAAKFKAAELTLECAEFALRQFGPGARFEHPLLDKLHREARAFEFMEGAGNMQRLNLAQGYLKRRILND